MSGGRNSPRRGLVTTTVSVRLTPDELEQLDALKEHSWEDRGAALRRAIEIAHRKTVPAPSYGNGREPSGKTAGPSGKTVRSPGKTGGAP